MKRALISIIVAGCATISAADPPRLVSTSPQFWALGVNPNLKTISLTFDQPMRPGFSDWIGRDILSPPSNLQTTVSLDRATLGIEVKLQPGKVYVLGLNEKGIPGVGFQNDKGLSLPPTYLVFQTSGPPAADDAPPRVIKTNPSNNTTQIDPRLSAITVVFDQAMGTKKHGLHVFENGKPVDISKLPFAYSPDGRTFTLPYSCKPSTQYRLEFNNLADIGFSRMSRVPLWPVQISFSTQ